MTTREDLAAAVDAAFEVTSRGMEQWPDPHPGRSPLDEEYSRVSDPAKWRIIGARAEAWMLALEATGLARFERGAEVEWRVAPGPTITRTDRVSPVAAGALRLAVARSAIEGVHDAGVMLGIGDPAECVTRFPDCGCDACDSGSQNELDEVDAHVLSIVSGEFRRLARGDKTITELDEGRWSASGLRGRDAAVALANPKGWNEVSGSSWFES